jgi:hypothetical protein
MNNKWQTLIEQLNVTVEPDLSPCNAKEIADFEQEYKIIFPSEFKSFCQTFGSVYFGNQEVHIRCPNMDFGIEAYRKSYQDVLLPQREDFMRWERSRQEAFEGICDLVEHSYLFGSTGVGLSFWFDLRTYSTDESYDIYIISLARDFGIECIGRSFFDFIHDYCLGTKFYDSLPEDMQLIEPYELVIEGGG